MAAEIINICEEIREWIEAGLNAPGDATVSREYIGPVSVDSITGRKVFVMPLSYLNNPADRGEDEWVYGVQVTVIEKYTDRGDPTKAWIDERVLFVQQKVSDRCDFVRTMLVFGTNNERRLLTYANEVAVYDEALLVQNKLFKSDVTFEFRETMGA
jgi:hypothetical protein